jgi:hypothetical protein
VRRAVVPVGIGACESRETDLDSELNAASMEQYWMMWDNDSDSMDGVCAAPFLTGIMQYAIMFFLKVIMCEL